MSKKRKLLLIHQNFPGQFKHLIVHLMDNPNYQVLGLTHQSRTGSSNYGGLLTYQVSREVVNSTHRYVRPFESAVLHGQAVARVLLDLRKKKWIPDVVLTHIGWGEGMFVKDVFPDTKLIVLCEFFYHGSGVDVGFDPEFPETLDDRLRLRAKNGHLLVLLDAMDLGVAATSWQRSIFPDNYQSKIIVNHEGIDINTVIPDSTAYIELPNGLVIKAGQRIVTYVARNLEPYRGFHVFKRCLEKLLERDPDCQILVVGGDGVSYGSPPEDSTSWRDKMLKEVNIDLNRVHFLGNLPYFNYLKVLQVSAVHIYLSYPFVVSWSLLEAMAAECVVIASSTSSTMEIIQDGKNGLLVDFFAVNDLVEKILKVLSDPGRYKEMRKAARATIEKNYSADNSFKVYDQLFK